MQHYKKRNAKKGKYGVTVPMPFAFDTRDKTRPKSIKERKAELDQEERDADMRATLNKVFRSKPIPPEVLQPRFQAITEANEERRMRIKQQCVAMTKVNEKPFNFWARDQAKMA